MSVANNLRRWREAVPLSREELAEKVGVSYESVYRIEKGQQHPRRNLLEDLARVFGRNPAEFYQEAPAPSDVAFGSRRIPILDFVQAGDFTVLRPDANGELHEAVFTDLNPSVGAFACRLRGRSCEPLYREGDLVIIDPDIYPRAEDMVVAVDANGEATFKQFHDRGLDSSGRRVFELVALNSAYPSWRSDRMQVTIRGTMIEHRRFRQR